MKFEPLDQFIKKKLFIELPLRIIIFKVYYFIPRQINNIFIYTN